jgi:hypothetical protein
VHVQTADNPSEEPAVPAKLAAVDDTAELAAVQTAEQQSAKPAVLAKPAAGTAELAAVHVQTAETPFETPAADDTAEPVAAADMDMPSEGMVAPVEPAAVDAQTVGPAAVDAQTAEPAAADVPTMQIMSAREEVVCQTGRSIICHSWLLDPLGMLVSSKDSNAAP